MRQTPLFCWSRRNASPETPRRRRRTSRRSVQRLSAFFFFLNWVRVFRLRYRFPIHSNWVRVFRLRYRFPHTFEGFDPVSSPSSPARQRPRNTAAVTHPRAIVLSQSPRCRRHAVIATAPSAAQKSPQFLFWVFLRLGFNWGLNGRAGFFLFGLGFLVWAGFFCLGCVSLFFFLTLFL